MPNCFILTKKGESEPTSLVKVDEEICAAMNMLVDDKWWCCGWYDSIGLSIAIGKDWDWMRNHFDSPETMAIIDFLEENYVTDAWAEIGRH